MAGNQLPILSCIVPLWLVRCMCGWKETRKRSGPPSCGGRRLVRGLPVPVRPLRQLSADRSGGRPDFPGDYGRFPALVETPKRHLALRRRATSDIRRRMPLKPAELIKRHLTAPCVSMKEATLAAWMPFILLCVLMVSCRHQQKAKAGQSGASAHCAGSTRSIWRDWISRCDGRLPPVVEKPTLEPAIFKFNWITTPGTSVLLTLLLVIQAAEGHPRGS